MCVLAHFSIKKSTHYPFVYSAEAHPLYLGCCALSAMDYPHICVENADLIINIGHDVVEKPPFFME